VLELSGGGGWGVVGWISGQRGEEEKDVRILILVSFSSSLSLYPAPRMAPV